MILMILGCKPVFWPLGNENVCGLALFPNPQQQLAGIPRQAHLLHLECGLHSRHITTSKSCFNAQWAKHHYQNI